MLPRFAYSLPSLTPNLAAKSSRLDRQTQLATKSQALPSRQNRQGFGIRRSSGEGWSGSSRGYRGRHSGKWLLEGKQRVCVIDGRSKVGQQPLFNLLEGGVRAPQAANGESVPPSGPGCLADQPDLQRIRRRHVRPIPGSWSLQSGSPRRSKTPAANSLRQQAICPKLHPRSGDRWSRNLRAHNCRIAK